MKTFDDFIEDTAGPDICGENAVTNDNEGTITFALHIHNRDAFVESEQFGVLLDTDKNPQTGVEGGDYLASVGPTAGQLAKWDGSGFVAQTNLAPAKWVPGFGPVFQLKAADLGGITSFDFVLFSTDGVNADFAPNAGTWSYDLTPLELSGGRLALDRARAGRSFSARLRVIRSDLGTPLMEGTVACSAKIGAAAVTGTGRFSGADAVCSWRLPKSARGKRMTGTVSVTFQNVVATKSFTRRIGSRR